MSEPAFPSSLERLTPEVLTTLRPAIEAVATATAEPLDEVPGVRVGS